MSKPEEERVRELENKLIIKTLENAKGAQVLSNMEERVKELEQRNIVLMKTIDDRDEEIEGLEEINTKLSEALAGALEDFEKAQGELRLMEYQVGLKRSSMP